MAPTVGPAAVLARVMIRTGNFINTGERIVSGLVRRLDLCDYVSDNAGSFKGRAPPRNGVFINLGMHQIYVSVDVSGVYPQQVVVAGEPPLSAVNSPHGVRPVSSVEVMVAAGVQAGTAGGGSSKDPTTGV